MALTYGTAAFTSGQQAVTSVSLDSGTLTYFQAGTEIAVGANPQIATVEAQKATGASSFNLKEPWPYPSGNYAFLASNTSEAFANGVQAAKGFQDALQSTVDNQGTAAAADVTTGANDTTAERVLRAGDAYAADSQNWHKGNLNHRVWGGYGGTNDDLFVFIALSSTFAAFYMEIDEINPPSSINITGSFAVHAVDGGTQVASGLTSSDFSTTGQSSNRLVRVQFSIPGGMVAGSLYTIRSSSSDSKFEVVP